MTLLKKLPLALLIVAAPLAAHEEDEVTVTNEMELPADATWKHSYDVIPGEKGEENAGLARAAAFYRIMEDHGVEAERVQIAVVVHGPAIYDVVKDARYAEKYGLDENDEPIRNPNFNTIAELAARGAEIWVCGVAAKALGVGNDDLLEGVKMAPAAMVANAELQRRGFTLNPY
ncbi:DsrE family protein [Altererythrobacter sp. MF3-039]|uniref:DsrE family protein n=1 Tax=Altererythrobacter sp. MF3-039 TaxID=3252901 RepID=UPI00390CC44B